MSTTILAKSSSGDPYVVVFDDQDERISVTCGCKAGALQQQCKHKRALVSGDKSMFFDATQIDVLDKILSSTQGQRLVQSLQAEEAALELIEREKARLSAEEKSIKNRMGKLFARGSG